MGDFMKLNFESYKDKVRACWIGKNIGGTMGTPYEGSREMNDIFTDPAGIYLVPIYVLIEYHTQKSFQTEFLQYNCIKISSLFQSCFFTYAYTFFTFQKHSL